MAIRTINRLEYQQNLSTQKEKKAAYGEIFTPFSMIKEMFEMLPATAFTNPDARWLDPGAGTGFFSMFLFWKLDIGLASLLPERKERHDHIIKNMIYMIEIQEDNASILKGLFGDDANVICEDFTKYKVIM